MLSPAPWPPRGFIYGVDVSRFQDSDDDGFGDLPGLLARLDYVASTGASWVWLLPIYPSLRRDNGYDVDDYDGIDPRFGTEDDLRAVIDGCHERGLSVMVDFIIHHTSDRHRWFQEGRRDRDSRYGRYYVWADKPIDDPDDRNLFPGEEDGVWQYDEVAGSWYHHQFYRFQPDLNLANPDVFEELVRVGARWLERGVDGFRLDAAIPAVQPKGTDGTSVDEGGFYDRLRRRLSQISERVVLLAEADVPPEELKILSDHRRVDAVLNFALNNRLFLALAREDASVMRDELERLDRSVPAPARVNFVRNVDELDLEQLTDDERDEVFRRFGTDPSMFLYGRGLRSGWAGLLGTGDRYRMTMSLLHALPGVPMLMQGQELGVGDDLSAKGRDAARPVMQWTDEPGGGFTAKTDAALILPAQRSGPLGFARVNVAAQSDDPGSLLSLTRRLAAARTEAGLESRTAAFTDAGAAPVLALRAGGLLTLHNLSGAPQRVGVREAEGASVLLAERWDAPVLGPYGFVWLEV